MVVGDVSGHGIGAALYMSTAGAFLRAFQGEDLVADMTRLNTLLEADFPADAFMTMVLARLYPDGSVVMWQQGMSRPGLPSRQPDRCARFDRHVAGALPDCDCKMSRCRPWGWRC